jgi:NADPH-dependent 7-cyano-7-deazaguanine reductase QueF
MYLYILNQQQVVVPNLESLARYIVSHRQVSHFHEEICEMILHAS